MTRKEWARRKMRAAVVLMPLGLALLIVGSFVAARSQAMLGVLVGSIGVFALTFGALAGRLAIAGPYPSWLEPGPEDAEVDGS